MKYKKIVHSHFKYELQEKIIIFLDNQYPKFIGNKFIIELEKTEISDPKSILTLYPGFRWDGNSGAIDTSKCLKASAIHDALCNTINDLFCCSYWMWLVYREVADEQYYKDMLRDGKSKMWSWARKVAMSIYRNKRSKEIRKMDKVK